MRFGHHTNANNSIGNDTKYGIVNGSRYVPFPRVQSNARLAVSPLYVQIHGRLVDSAPKIIELPVVFFRYCPASDFDCICSEKNGNVVAIIR